jgi:hypothetical protein
MASCPKCGKNNADDAAFCTSCGIPIRSDVSATIERHAKQFAQTMEQAGKKVGDQMTQAAKTIHTTTQREAQQVERRMNAMSRRTESWYDRSFGPIGPLLESLIFLIVFRLIILVMELTNEASSEIQTVAAILLVYLLPFFVLSLLSNYTQYLSRRYFPVKVFSPLLYAVFFVLFCWVISRILFDVSMRFSIQDVQTAATSLENSLPTIFIFVLLLGYLILMVNLPRDHGKKP